MIRSPRLTFSIASFLLINPSPHEFHPPFNSDSLAESYLVGSKYLLLISTASTCFEFEKYLFFAPMLRSINQLYLGRFKLFTSSMACSRPTLPRSKKRRKICFFPIIQYMTGRKSHLSRLPYSVMLPNK